MEERSRPLNSLLRERLLESRQTVFVTGPRQVGKTTSCGAFATASLDWSDPRDRLAILRGPAMVANQLGLAQRREREAVVLFDNLCAYSRWPAFLRGFRARSGSQVRLLVTGLDEAPGKSVRVHPWSVGECVRGNAPSGELQAPAPISDEDWTALSEHGGFPEPFLRRDSRFTRRWQSGRNEAVAGDVHGFVAVHDPHVMQTLALLLTERAASPLVYAHLAQELNITVDTVRRWIDRLVRAQYGFLVRPWSRGVPKSLRKEPKWFLRDWSGINRPAERRRTFVACHLLKAVQGWADRGLGRFELCYVRDKLKREVDFLVVREGKPWFLVAVSESADLTAALSHFQGCTRARHAFQVAFDQPFAAVDCFEQTAPVIVPARTFLSQLL